MIGILYIDGTDVYAQYGVVLQGGYASLMAYPPLKGVNSNDWAEEDGLEADLSVPVLEGIEFNPPVLDKKEVSLQFMARSKKRVGAFLQSLSDKGYHEFNFTELGRKFTLRLLSQSSDKLIPGDGDSFTLRFSDDFPLKDYQYLEPQSSLTVNTGYVLDGRDLARYGIRVLQGSEASVRSLPPVKSRLTMNINSLPGVIYDGTAPVKYQAKDVTLQCLMQAESMSALWHNYNAFLYDLKRPSYRTLSVAATSRSYSCYYKNGAVSRFFPDDKAWLEFTVTFVFTDFRPAEEL